MSKYQLAQLNVATLKAPLDSPQLKDFVDNLDRINELAQQSPGFVWRLKGDGNRVPEGHEPTVAEAVARLQHLRKHGPSAEAFTFGEAFAAADAKGAGTPFSFEDSCPA